MKIGVDFDNVLSNSTEVYLEVYNELVSANYKLEDVIYWDIAEILPKEHKLLADSLWDNETIWDRVKPIEDSQSRLLDLSLNNEIYIVTSSSAKSMVMKEKWLKKYFPFIYHKDIIIIRDKQLLNLDVLIDDYEVNLINGNYKKILFNYPWNVGYKNNNDIVRVNSWSEIHKIIKTL